MSESIIHIPKSTSGSSPIHFETWIDQREADGLYALIQFIDGFEAGKGGSVPGKFELVMLYRKFYSAIKEKLEKQSKTK